MTHIILVKPYSLSEGRVGEPIGGVLVWSRHRSLAAAHRILASLIGGKRRGMIERAIRLHIYGPNYAGGEPLGYRVGIRDTDAPGSFMTCNEARDKLKARSPAWRGAVLP